MVQNCCNRFQGGTQYGPFSPRIVGAKAYTISTSCNLFKVCCSNMAVVVNLDGISLSRAFVQYLQHASTPTRGGPAIFSSFSCSNIVAIW